MKYEKLVLKFDNYEALDFIAASPENPTDQTTPTEPTDNTDPYEADKW